MREGEGAEIWIIDLLLADTYNFSINFNINLGST